MKHNDVLQRVLAALLCVVMVVGLVPGAAFAASYDSTASGDYFTVISSNEYALAPGATETEIVLNNSEGSDRKVVHVFEVDPTNESIEIIPGYYGIDKLDPDNLALDGVSDKTEFWKDAQLTKTVAYYEDVLGYNVVGAMNTALAYDSNAPYGYMVWNGVVLGTPEVHKGAQTYLAIYKDGSAELRSMSTPLDGNEWTAISANFGWLVKEGKLVSTSVERTSSDASRSMIGIKADGTIVFCQVDGRNAPTSTGLSNYEMGEMMLALGCVNAVNCDGGGSSTFISKREGTNESVMRSIPSDGSERPTINSVIIVSKATATGIFDHAVVESEYDYIAPGASMKLSASGVDTNGYPVDIPADVTWQVADSAGGTMASNVFTAGNTEGKATVQMIHNGKIVGEKTLNIVHPESFGFTAESTVIPYNKSSELVVEATYGVDSWAVCIDGAFSLTLSDSTAATLNGNILTATSDESIAGVSVTATYLSNSSVTDVIEIAFGKGSEILFDFEDGDVSAWMGFQDAKQWSIDNGVNNTLVGSSPLAGQFNEQIGSDTFLASRENGGQVKNGNYALAWSLDNTDASFAGWSYNVLFYVGEQIVLRDVANGKNPTRLGMWLYIPENAPGLSFQSQLYTANPDGSLSCKQDHFTFTTASGVVKNLNSCTEADIPESRWVYVSIDLTKYDFLATPDATDESNSRSPSIVRTYVKPIEPAVITFYVDDITLDYSNAVDDRVLPSISNVTYATADESKELSEGTVISGNSIGFAANVADNAGLNNSTGVILVDGVAIPTTVSGNVMSSENVVLNPGVHTVTYEIQDKLGNMAKATRSFTISGDAVVSLSGHNDSGAPAEYDSVYYADINVADLADIKTLTATIYLQTANTWEPQGIQVADGFEATYEHCTVSNQLTVTVTRVEGTKLGEGNTLVSLPIRVWSWNGVNNVTGAAIAPEAQFATGECPVVEIRYEVVKGAVVFNSNSKVMGVFGGSQTVKTNLNDNVNPWHYHDKELTVMEQEVTCTDAGFTGRTYCETCKSIVNWGSAVAAKGHEFEKIDNVLKCKCGELYNGTLDGLFYTDGVVAQGWVNDSYYNEGVTLTGIQVIDDLYYDFGEDGICKNQAKLTGLFQMDGKTYYAIAGKLVGGWQMIDNAWYYFDPTTFAGAHGDLKLKVKYHFTDGKLDSGIWYHVSGQYRYWYGPDYYRQTWATIDGKDYYFGKTGYRYVGYNTICPNLNSRDPIYQLYLFDDKGVSQGLIDVTGLYNANGNLYYLNEGTCVYAKLVKVDGDYYYIASDYLAVKNVTRYIADDCTNGLLNAGYYTFGEDGKMVIEQVEEKNGIIDGYYYVDGQIARIGLFKLDGAYYYASTTNGKLAVNITRYVAKDCIDASASDMKAGYYTFGDDYRMVIGGEEEPTEPEATEPEVTEPEATEPEVTEPEATEPEVTEPEATEPEVTEPEVKNGIIDGYYYVNGEIAKIGLFKLDGAYYYASTTNGKLAVNIKRYVAKDCIHESAADMKAGYYTFGSDYKMVIEQADTTKNGIIDGYYYINGEIAKIGLFKLDGAYYYASTTNGKLAVNIERYVSKDCIHESAADMKAGYYTFGSDYKMVIEQADTTKNGIIDGYYYINGEIAKIGLFKLDGAYYYASTTNGKLAVSVTRYVAKDCIHVSASDMKAGYYTFDANGKMVIG